MIIIKKPVITEKMTRLTEASSNPVQTPMQRIKNRQPVARCRYAFIVQKDANKYQIKDAIEKLYDVKVTDVNTMNYDGKKKSRYTKSGVITGKTAAFKKAIVTLREGDTIDFYSNI